MNQLIAITSGSIGGETKQTVNARDLHGFLEVGKDFSTWIKDRIESFGFVENQDFVCSPILGSNGRGGHNRVDYHLALDMAKELSMVERNEKGKQARQYFIECERRVKNTVFALNDPVMATLQAMQVVRQEQLEQRKLITDLQDSIRISAAEQKLLMDAKNRKVSCWLRDYPQLNQMKAHQGIWRCLNSFFEVPRYNEIKKVDFDTALQFINELVPKTIFKASELRSHPGLFAGSA